MRNVKFRGKRIAPEGISEWVYGFLFKYETIANDLITEILVSCDEHGTMARFDAVPETVGQFIGEIDINNKEIYYRDILKVHDSRYPQRPSFIGVVDFQDASFVIKNDCVTHYRWMDYEVEIIGNKFENIELLEGDEQ